MKKFITFIGISSLILFGCSGEDIQDTEATASQESSEKVYETKDLKFDDLKDIEIGDSVEKVYEQLGEPLKKWSSEFVYEELEDLVYRSESVLALLGDLDPEMSEEYDYVIEQAEKALKIDKLTMLQYTYTYEEDTEETALYWISPRTDTVVSTSNRQFIDEDGNGVDNDVHSSKNTDYIEEKDPNNSSIAEVGWEIGGYVQYETDDGLQYNIQLDSVSKNYGDDYHEPKGPFFAKVDFTVMNHGLKRDATADSDVLDISSYEFEFYDSEGIKGELISKDFFSESIQAGKSAQGTAYFDVVSDGDTFSLYYDFGLWTDEYE